MSACEHTRVIAYRENPDEGICSDCGKKVYRKRQWKVCKRPHTQEPRP